MPKAKTGPKPRTRYCAICGTKCEGAVVAANHCKGKGTRPIKTSTPRTPKKNLSQ